MPKLGPRKGGDRKFGATYKLKVNKDAKGNQEPVIYKQVKENDWGPEIDKDGNPVYYDNLVLRVVGVSAQTKSHDRYGDALFVNLDCDTGEGGPSRVQFPLNWMTRSIMERLSDVEPGEPIEISCWVQKDANGDWPTATIKRAGKSIARFFDSQEDPGKARKSMGVHPDKWLAFIEKHVTPRFEGYVDAELLIPVDEPEPEQPELVSEEEGDDSDLPF